MCVLLYVSSGYTLSCSNECLVVGAPGTKLNNVESGAAYAYRIHLVNDTSTSDLHSVPYIHSSGLGHDGFGAHVAVFGSRFIVGADNALNTGAVYLADINESLPESKTSVKNNVGYVLYCMHLLVMRIIATLRNMISFVYI